MDVLVLGRKWESKEGRMHTVLNRMNGTWDFVIIGEGASSLRQKRAHGCDGMYMLKNPRYYTCEERPGADEADFFPSYREEYFPGFASVSQGSYASGNQPMTMENVVLVLDSESGDKHGNHQQGKQQESRRPELDRIKHTAGSVRQCSETCWGVPDPLNRNILIRFCARLGIIGWSDHRNFVAQCLERSS